MYIDSNNIKIYPTASRNLNVDYGANVNLEQNIVGLSNNITDYDSYIVEGLEIVENADSQKQLKLKAGQCVIHGYSVKILNDIELHTAGIHPIDSVSCFVIISLDTEKILLSNNQIEKINGTDNRGVYEPIKITISTTPVTDYTYDLLLGQVLCTKSSGTYVWSVISNNDSIKFKSDTMQINLSSNSGLTRNNQQFKGSFKDWLSDSFIFDDGDLSDYTQSIDEIFVEYTNGITLNIPTSGLSTTLSSDMIPGISNIKTLIIPNYFTEVSLGTLSGAGNLESLTLPFVGQSATKQASDTYQYPFGYIFGTSSYSGGESRNQTYYGSSTSTLTHTSYYIPSSLTDITINGGNLLHGAFSNCADITTITLSNDVVNIYESVFNGCTNLIKVILPNSLDNIAGGLFMSCENLIEIELPNTITSIGDYAFYYCTSLTSITIPDNVTSINGNAFSRCASLTNIIIPEDVSYLGIQCFKDCTGLTSITCLSIVPPTLGSGVFANTNNCPIYVPTNSVVDYQTAWTDYSSRIVAIPE